MKLHSELASDSQCIELLTGSRLHFGLMELSEGEENQYAGLGVMLEQPSLQLRLRLAPQPAAAADLCSLNQRIMSLPVAEKAAVNQVASKLSVVEYQRRVSQWLEETSGVLGVDLIAAYPFHSGLGTGTQLACLLYFGNRFTEKAEIVGRDWTPIQQLFPEVDSVCLAQSTGRGQRSAIGVQGFLSGGLIVDSGRNPASSYDLTHRTRYIEFPSQWRFVIIQPRSSSGITGQVERRLMEQVSRRPNPSRRIMRDLAEGIYRAVSLRDFSGFATGLEDYLDLASQLFAPVQDGCAYNGPECQLAARVAKAVGLRAVGQSSWGPTIFGISESVEQARRVVSSVLSEHPSWHVQLSAAATEGAKVRRVDF